MANRRKLSMLIRTAGRKPAKIGPGERLRIGRHASNDLVFNDGTVSRFHAVLVWDPDEDRPYVRDNESANGVEVNGQPIDERRHLDGGDTVSIGDFTLSLELRVEEVAAVDGAAALASSSDDEVTLFTDKGKELQGETSELRHLQQLFLELEEQRRTGTLQLTGADLNGVCLFSQGKVMAAEAAAPSRPGSQLEGRDALRSFFEQARVKFHFSKALKPTESALEISARAFLAELGFKDTRRAR